MARKATGQVIEKKTKRGRVYALRFRANGDRHYLTLGTAEEGWDRRGAEEELQNVLADVRRGIWKPPRPEPVVVATEDPTFHEFASEWFERHRPEWREKTIRDYEWAICGHLLPFFAEHRLTQITVAEVDRYKAAKLGEHRLAPAQINKTITRLAQIFDEAVEYEHLALDRNSARGRRRKLKAPKPRRSWVEPEQLPALLEAADEWFRPVVATLVGSGLRVGEAVALDWRDVNLRTGTITVRESKTDAGRGRQVDLPLGLHEELVEWKARTPRPEDGDPVFVSRARSGAHRRQTERNVLARLKTTIRRANERLERLGIEPISERVTNHSLRRTYASLRSALRDDPIYIAEQIGHTDARFTLNVYAKAVKRRERLSGAYLEAFDQALEWALMGTNGHPEPIEAFEPEHAEVADPAPASDN